MSRAARSVGLGALAAALAACAGRPAETHVVSVTEPAVTARPTAPAVVDPPAAPSGEPTIRIAMNDRALCALARGRVHCFDRAQQRADGGALLEAPPVEGIVGAVDLAMAGSHGCAVLSDGAVACFGENGQGQLGAGIAEGSSKTARRVLGLRSVRSVHAGPAHTCAITTTGVVWCWGENAVGQTGSATHYAPAARELVTATQVPDVTGARALGLSYGVTCAAAARGVWCWGETLGRGQRSNHPPALDASFPDVASFGAGSGGVCAVDAGGHVACRASGWGGDEIARGAASLSGVRKVGVGSSHACALGSDRRVSCWGANYSGQLGFARDKDGASADDERTTPVPVAKIPPAVDLAVGAYGACVLSASEELFCWGSHAGSAAEEGTGPVQVRLR